jgi:hypothetical protein
MSEISEEFASLCLAQPGSVQKKKRAIRGGGSLLNARFKRSDRKGGGVCKRTIWILALI